MPRITAERNEVFVLGTRHPDEPDVGLATRRPVPVAEEALMYPVDRTEMSAPRRAMMARRRRSLTVLGVGSLVALLLAAFMGGATWFVAVPFIVGLAGYLLFLRGRARHDRERRASRQLRSVSRRARDYDATELADVAPESSTRVRIDDDDIELHNLDTVDLTGLYNESFDAPPQRRAG